ncbi:hypothetical protein BDZ94DRAFT_1261194 [Collybia nuda]|uniref:Uncharacterized protein n=1 Tax=Collybia nuda TaxID=64659 RepID=A0A9P5Y3D0_9AGAR|nr:hypothetical protein BDZ94DRAFT_1261194 [Collybia nuda]
MKSQSLSKTTLKGNRIPLIDVPFIFAKYGQITRPWIFCCFCGVLAYVLYVLQSFLEAGGEKRLVYIHLWLCRASEDEEMSCYRGTIVEWMKME